MGLAVSVDHGRVASAWMAPVPSCASRVRLGSRFEVFWNSGTSLAVTLEVADGRFFVRLRLCA